MKRIYLKRKALCPTVHPDWLDELYDEQQRMGAQLLDMEQRFRALDNSNNARAEAEARRAAIYNQIEEKDKLKCKLILNLN